MAVHWPIVFNLVNSIVGVSVLAIPFCFHECGIILGPLAMLGSAWVTKKSCLLLLTAAQLARRSSYESLAQHTYGRFGKLAVEASIIGLCFGTLCAFNVIIGDLAPSIVNNLLGLQQGGSSRPMVMMMLTLGVGLPLSLMRNISSLAAISAMSLVFYTGFVSQVFLGALPSLFEGSWWNQIHFWRPAGFLRCLPIFSLAYACQTQLFVLYDSLPEPSVKKMEEVVNTGINLVSFVYISVGSMCYITYYKVGLKGDVLVNYGDSFIAEILQTGFVMSVIVSIPLMAFPMRASLNSLLFPSQTAGTENMPGGPGYMPQNRFVIVTVTIITITLVIGILIPQIEFVLGLTGATMGTLIAFIFPSVMFLMTVSDTQNNLRIIARALLFVGMICAVCSTYSVLNATPSHHDNKVDAKPHVGPNVLAKPKVHFAVKSNVSSLKGDLPKGAALEKKLKANVDGINLKVKPSDVDGKAVKDGPVEKAEEKGVEKRHEPAVPHPPKDKDDKVEPKQADPVNEKRQLMSTDLKVAKKDELVEKPAAQDELVKPVVVKQADQDSKPAKKGSPDSKIEVSEKEIDAEIAKLKEKKAEVDANIKNLEDLKVDNPVEDPKKAPLKAESRGKRDLEKGGKGKDLEEKDSLKSANKEKSSELASNTKESADAVVVTPKQATTLHPSPSPGVTTPKGTTQALEASSTANDTAFKSRDLKSSKVESGDPSKESKERDLRKRSLYIDELTKSLRGKRTQLLKRRALRTKEGRKIEVR